MLKFVTVLCLSASMMLTGCKKEAANGQKTVTIGMVAKSQSNDVFQAAYAGAKDAAERLGKERGVNIVIEWRTPPSEDATAQVNAIEALTRGGASAILVSCSDAATLTPAINQAAEKGIPVMTFDSDAPASKRFAFYGTGDEECGRRIMAALAKSMGNKGTVAILGGNQSAPNLQLRVNAAKAEVGRHPEMKLLDAAGGVFYHQETPEKSAEAVANATNANPQIQGWCFVGGWPLFTSNALRWEPGKIKVASCDALPAQLDYLRSGHVDILFAQDCYGWGEKGVETLVAKVLDNKDPSDVKMVDPLKEVTRENVDAFAGNWEKWLGKKK